MKFLRSDNFTKRHVIAKRGRYDCFRRLFLDSNTLIRLINKIVIYKVTKNVMFNKYRYQLQMRYNLHGIEYQYKITTTFAPNGHLFIHFKFFVFIGVVLVSPFKIIVAVFRTFGGATCSDLATSLLLNLVIDWFFKINLCSKYCKNLL